MLREIKDDLKKLRDKLCSCVAKLRIVKMSVLHKLIYRFDVIPVKIVAGSFCCCCCYRN